MGKARRKSTALIPLGKAPAAKQPGKAPTKPIMYREACERAAKRLDVDDVDYAERRLCQLLLSPTIKFGRDWFASQVEPEGADVTELWRHFGYTLVVDRNRNKATFKRPVDSDGGLGLEDVTAYGIRVVPAVIEAWNIAAPAPKRESKRRVGSPTVYDDAQVKQVEQAIADAFKEYGPSAAAKKVAGYVKDKLADKTPRRTKLYGLIRDARENHQ
jgi:hypothetical protein